MTGCPLSVRLADGSRDLHVTKQCRSLAFTKTAPGGHAAASTRLLIDRRTWADLGDSDRLWFYDRRSARTIWEGYTTFPGQDEDQWVGQSVDLAARGGADLLKDDRRALVYVDRAGDNWKQDGGIAPSSLTQWGQAPAIQPDSGLVVGFNPGQPIGTNALSGMAYYFDGTDMEWGETIARVDSGKTDAGYENYFSWLISGVTTRTPLGHVGTISTTKSGTFDACAGETSIGFGAVVGVNAIGVGMKRLGGATTVADDTTYSAYAPADLIILGRRRDRNGNLVIGYAGMGHAGAGAKPYVLASDVVEDLLGRMMPWADPAASTIEVTTNQIDQLVYRQAVSTAQVLDDLALWEADYLYEVLASSGTGKRVFNWRAWPTTPRYEISVRDGYNRPGSDQGLCNRVIVSWTDEAGKAQTLVVVLAVPELDMVGRIRHAEGVTLPEGHGSAVNAAVVGAQALADANRNAGSARARVRRPVLDLYYGQITQPYEIEPGYLVRVRETGEVFRLTQLDYRWSADGTSEADLTLGKPLLSLEQRFKRMEWTKP